MMEIYILLAGVEMGPFSESQVKDYLREGLVSPSDKAKTGKTGPWEPVEAVLVKMPKPGSATIPVHAPTPAEPSAKAAPVATTPPPATIPTPPAPVMTPPVAAPAPVPATAVITPPAPVVNPAAPARPTASSSMPTITTTAALLKQKKKPTRIILQPIQPLTGTGEVKIPSAEKSAPLPEMRQMAPKIPVKPGPAPAAPASAPEKMQVKVITPLNRSKSMAPSPETVVLPKRVAVLRSPAPPSTTPPTSDAAGALLPPPLPAKRRRTSAPAKPWFERVPPAAIYAVAGLIFLFCYVGSFLLTMPVVPDTTPAIQPATAAPPAPPQEEKTGPPEPKTAADFDGRGLGRQKNGDLDGALDDFNQSLTLDPKGAQVFFHRGHAKQAKGDLDGAIDDYTQALALDPHQADAYSNRGFAKQSKGDLDGAVADYTQALLIDPKIAEAYYNRGLIKEKRNDMDGAITDYNHALDLDPKMDVAYYYRGNAKNAQGNLDGAIADYTQAITLNPKLPDAYCNRGFARQSKGDLDGALLDYNQAIALDPKLSVPYYLRGLIKEQKGDLDGAIADSTQAITYNPSHAEAYCNRGLARLGKNDLGGSLSDLEKFCELAPRDDDADDARLYIWLISKKQNPTGDADSVLSAALLTDWNSTPSDLTSQIASFLLGHLNENDLIAAAESTDPVQDQRQHCKAWYFAGIKRLLAGDTTNAAACFRKSLATQAKGYCEYIFAQTELKALNQGP